MGAVPNEPLYKRIYNDLAENIRSGVLKPGDRLPTEAQLMTTYGVSRITASRAMSELAKDGLIVRTRKIGSVVAQEPAPPPFATFEEELIPLVVPINATDAGDLINGIQQRAQEYGFVIPLYNTNRDLNTERQVLEDLLKKDIGGLICYPLESYRNIDVYLEFLKRQIPIVFLDRPIGGIRVPVVASDNFSAGYDMTSMLIRKGHRRLAFVSYSTSSYTTNQRLQGFLQAQWDVGIRPAPEHILHLNRYTPTNLMMTENNTDSERAVREMLQQLMDTSQPPTALMCEHDMLASYVERQAHLLHISIPRALSVTGFDNQSFCDHVEVPLTSVAQNFYQIGQKAVEHIAALKSGKTVAPVSNIACSIVERASVATLRK